MKQHLYDWHIELPNLCTHRAYVLEKLCHYASDRTLEACVTIDRLHQHVRGGRRTVQVALRELEEMHHIERTGDKRIPTGGLVPVYRVAPDLALGAAAASTSAPSGRKWLHGHKKEEEKKISKEIRLSSLKNALPPELNDDFTARYGLDTCASVLSGAELHVEAKAIVVKSTWAKKKLASEGRHFLDRWDLTVATREEVRGYV